MLAAIVAGCSLGTVVGKGVVDVLAHAARHG